MTMTRDHPTSMPSGDDSNKRPKGILKNSSSFSNPAPVQPSPTEPVSTSTISPSAAHFSDKELTLQNTLQNAGRRRSSSAARAGSASRRQSAIAQANNQLEGDSSPRLKWDEANLYLAEQEKTSKMKIDEPKTPYAPRYDPAADEDDLEMLDPEERVLDAGGLKVDELDQTKSKKGVSEDDIPGLKLGEPENEYSAADLNQDRIVRERSMSNNSNKSEKHVVVGASGDNAAEAGDDGLLTSEEAKRKHQEFEERRKKHYEMKDVKDLLGHPEDLDEMIEDDEDDNGPPPPVPKVPEHLVNGQR